MLRISCRRTDQSKLYVLLKGEENDNMKRNTWSENNQNKTKIMTMKKDKKGKHETDKIEKMEK